MYTANTQAKQRISFFTGEIASWAESHHQSDTEMEGQGPGTDDPIKSNKHKS